MNTAVACRLALGDRVVWIGKDDCQPSGPDTITRITAHQVEVLWEGTKPGGAIAARSCTTFDTVSSLASSVESGSSEGATMPKETDVEAALANCRALINQINAGLSAEKPLVNVSSAAELPFYLEFTASTLKKSAPRP